MLFDTYILLTTLRCQSEGAPNFNRLYKIRPLSEHLKDTFVSAFTPSRFVSEDESMVAFKGRSTMKQYMPLKPIKRGFKVWILCCAITGYMLSFQVYTGKERNAAVTLNMGENVLIVLRLSKALKGLCYCLFFDNFFTSVPLCLCC